MKKSRIYLLIIILMIMGVNLYGQTPFKQYFIDRTMRVDYFHTGSKEKEIFAVDGVYNEGSWAGSTVNLIDTLNLGEYLLRIFDQKTSVLIYSRGFSTLLNEWQSTDEAAKGIWKTVSESVLIPFPQHSIQLVISKRDKYKAFHELFTTVIDPNDRAQIILSDHHKAFQILPLIENGDSHKKVDILILGDGYAKEDLGKFNEDAKHFCNVLFSTSPFKDRKDDFNVRALAVTSPVSGIDIPDQNIWKNNALGTRYSTFGLARYVLTEANKALRDIASQVPYDFITILLNDSRYGGGGIYQLYTTTYTIETNPENRWQRDYVYVHEFGHSFGGLGDEYYSSSVAYNDFYPKDVEPWEPNLTRLLDKGRVKWNDIVTKDIPLPTDWNKREYDSLASELGKASRDKINTGAIRQRQKAILANDQLHGKVGAFEGAGYMSTGIYRPSLNCRMFSLSLEDFDPVCRAAIERQIDFYSH